MRASASPLRRTRSPEASRYHRRLPGTHIHRGPWRPITAVVMSGIPGRGVLNNLLDDRNAAVRTARTAGLRPGILLDRDGTIIVDHGYVGSIDRVEFIEGAPEAIAAFNRAGLPVAVVTNQAGVARGLYGIDDVALVHAYIAQHLAEFGAHIDLFVFSPYHPAGVVDAFARASEDRKPRPG